VTRAEAGFVCRQPVGLAAGTIGRHALSLDRLLANVNSRAGYKSKMKYFPFQRAPILSLLRTVHALRACCESDSECRLLYASHKPIAGPEWRSQ
jgi:hypothetical protein